MATLERAMQLAGIYHDTQKDKGGNPYVLHLMRLAVKAKTNDEAIVAILHDIVEDTFVTLDHLHIHGFADHIVSAVDSLTKRDGENYFDFIKRIKLDSLATAVKILDIQDNMDLSRLEEVTQKDIDRNAKYGEALKLLKKSV